MSEPKYSPSFLILAVLMLWWAVLTAHMRISAIEGHQSTTLGELLLGSNSEDTTTGKDER